MKLDDLKQSLGALTLQDLEALGVVEKDTWNDDVLMLTTSEENDEIHNESTWVAAVNTEDTQLMIITNGMITPDAPKPEVGRVYVNEEKAEMLLEALRHAFPEVLREYTSQTSSKLRRKRYDCDSKLLSIASMEGAKTAAQAIKVLQKTIVELRSLRKKGYEFETKVRHNTVSVKPKPLSNDKKIDVHQAIKKQLAKRFNEKVSVSVISEPAGKSTYIATAQDSDKSYLVQVCIDDLAADNSLRDARVIEITPSIKEALLNG